MKLIVDIPDMAYEAYKEWHKQGVSTVEQSLIALAVPYEEALRIMCEKCPVYNCVSGCNSYRSIEKMSSVKLQIPKGGAE